MNKTHFHRWILLSCLIALAGCTMPPRKNDVLGRINSELQNAATQRKSPAVEVSDQSLMPPLTPPVPAGAPAEPRFDLSVVDAPATQVFMALVSGTRYSMLLPPDISGTITITLKDVTVIEALDTIRELFGYEFRIQGKRIFIEPNTMRTRVFNINYLASRRIGSSELRVSGNSVSNAGTGGTSGTNNTLVTAGNLPTPAGTGTPTSTQGDDTSRVSMATNSDFWGDLRTALTAIVGTTDGRNVVINASSGVIVVRALPNELRNVEKYLKTTQLIADRQVMLEAKIIDVTLAEGFQSGVNWAAFRGNTTFGVTQPGATIGGGNGTVLTAPGVSVTPGSLGSISASPNAAPGPLGSIGSIAATALGQGFIGLAFQTSNFAALLNFLETQGNVAVLSSPRIATLNNQKAVLKVGTDELFITNVTSSTTTTTTGSVSSPSLTLQPYFSGISLDVTPQIDDEGNIILHIHPAVSTVTEKTKVIDLGDQGTFRLPLASSEINETDSIVRAQNGNIVAIGGLMRQAQSSDRSQLPGTSGIAASLLGQRGSASQKRELVILIKPTLIQNDSDWARDLKEAQDRVLGYTADSATQ